MRIDRTFNSQGECVYEKNFDLHTVTENGETRPFNEDELAELELLVKQAELDARVQNCQQVVGSFLATVEITQTRMEALADNGSLTQANRDMASALALLLEAVPAIIEVSLKSKGL